MKELGRFLKIVFIVALMSITGCEEKKYTEHQKEIEVVAPAQIVEIAEAKKMYDTYSKRRVPIILKYEESINRNQQKLKESNITDEEGFDVGRFVYYDYKTIKQYLAFIEQEAKEANVEISTLRFYFSNYPDEVFFSGTKDSIKHPRRNSILLSPTYNDGKRNFLFYIAQGVNGAEAIPLNDSFGNIKGLGKREDTSTKAYASISPNLTTTTPSYNLQDNISLTMNRGTGVPPPKQQE